MLTISGSNVNPLIITTPTAAGSSSETLLNLGDVNITPPLADGQFLVYADATPPSGSLYWRNETLVLTGTNGITTAGTGYTRTITVDNTVIRTNAASQTITGNLTVTGTLTYGGLVELDTGVSIVTTPVQLINAGYTGTTEPGFNTGILVNRGPNNQATGLIFNETINQWTVENRTGFDVTAPGFPNTGTGTPVSPPVGQPPNNIIWSAWNDGASSGLDADLLDGQQGAFYQNASSLNAGTLLSARLPAFTGGDVTSVAGTATLTLTTFGSSAGTWGSSTAIPAMTVDNKGRITTASNIALATASNSATGVVSLATQAETTTGTNNTKAVTPLSIKPALDGKQPLDGTLTALANVVTTGTNNLIYATAADTFSTTGLSAYGRTLIDDVDAATARTTLGIPAGTVFSPFTPIQQGGGAGQGTNKVYIGWSASGLLLQVDATDFANTWPISINRNAASATTLTGMTTSVAELNFVDGTTSNVQAQINAKAPLASPAFTGSPTAPTPAAGDNNTSIATTAFVQSALAIVTDTRTWQPVTRSFGVNYVNDTGRLIVFLGEFGRNAVSTSNVNLVINGLSLPLARGTNSGGGNVACGSLEIPAGATYSLVNVGEGLSYANTWEFR